MKNYQELLCGMKKINISSTFQNQAKCFTKVITSIYLLDAENESFFDG